MSDVPNRLSPVECELECGTVDWRVRGLVLDERIGEPFRAELRLATAGTASVRDLLDRDATLTLTRGAGLRRFRGCITRAEILGTSLGELQVRVRLEPLVVRVRSARRFRMFQELSVPEIVARVLAGVTGVRVEAGLFSEHAARDYCVQYDESDLAFVSRVLEDQGIAWIVDDTGDVQRVLLIDDPRGFPEATTDDPQIHLVRDRHDQAAAESVQSIVFVHRPPSPAVGERDWDWIDAAPSVRTARYPEDATTTHERWHPRRWAPSSLLRSVQHDYEARAAGDVVARGEANVLGFAAGTSFELEGDTDAIPLLLLGVRHTLDAGERGGAHYRNTFECMPLAVPYRPRCTMPRPRIHGLQTAVVVGPTPEEIHTDALGRIQVAMHWQPPIDGEVPASCWMRTGQLWAGAGFGTVVVPRVGMEVLVAFLDGDPDRPVCVGCLYNGANGTPYPLPDERTKTTLRTRSSPGGGGYNELSFEDAAGSEEVYLRAQRNLREVVLANHSERVGVDDSATVGRDRTTTIDRHETHGVGGDRSREVGGSESVQIAGSQHVVVRGGPAKGTAIPPAPPGASVSVQGAYTLDVRDQITIRCGASVITMSPLGITVAGPLVSIDGGGSTFALVPGAAAVQSDTIAASTTGGSELNLADGVRIGSGASVKLQVADSRLTLDGTTRLRGPTTLIEGTSQLELVSDTRATLQAPSVDITADETATVTSLAALELSGVSVTTKASGPHTIRGLPIHLNPPGGA